jgi:hypothetical protein
MIRHDKAVVTRFLFADARAVTLPRGPLEQCPEGQNDVDYGSAGE